MPRSILLDGGSSVFVGLIRPRHGPSRTLFIKQQQEADWLIGFVEFFRYETPHGAKTVMRHTVRLRTLREFERQSQATSVVVKVVALARLSAIVHRENAD